MEPNQTSVHPRTSAKDFFLHLGTMVALYSTAISLVNLLFTVINKAYPQIGAYYYGSYSISFPVSMMIIMFPIFVLLMWLLERGYVKEPEKRNLGIKKWLTYITLFISGLITAGDLITVVYYFIDGQELTTGFLLKVLSVFAVSLAVFMYYITDIREKLTSLSRRVWVGASVIVILGAIIVGFSVLGSPRTQQLIKYDEQKVADLQNIKYQVENYFYKNSGLPDSISDLSKENYNVLPVDPQTKTAYEYKLVGQSAKAYELCATFNKETVKQSGVSYPFYDGQSDWRHPAGHFCFSNSIPVSMYKSVPIVQ